MLGLLLEHEPDSDPVSHAAGSGTRVQGLIFRKQIAEHGMSIGLALEKPSERHHEIRIINAAILMIHSILQKREHISRCRFANLPRSEPGQSPAMGQVNAFGRCSEVHKRAEPPYLAEEIAVQPTGL